MMIEWSEFSKKTIRNEQSLLLQNKSNKYEWEKKHQRTELFILNEKEKRTLIKVQYGVVLFPSNAIAKFDETRENVFL